MIAVSAIFVPFFANLTSGLLSPSLGFPGVGKPGPGNIANAEIRPVEMN